MRRGVFLAALLSAALLAAGGALAAKSKKKGSGKPLKRYQKFKSTVADAERKDRLGWVMTTMMPPQLLDSNHPAHDPRFPHVDTDFYENEFFFPHARVLRTNRAPVVADHDLTENMIGAGIDPPPNAPQSYRDFLKSQGAGPVKDLSDVDRRDYRAAGSEHEKQQILKRNANDRDGLWQRVAGTDPNRASAVRKYAQSKGKPAGDGSDFVVSPEDAKSSWVLFLFAGWCDAAKSAAPHFFELARRIKAAEVQGKGPLGIAERRKLPEEASLQVSRRINYKKDIGAQVADYGLQAGVVNITRDSFAAKAFDMAPFGERAIPQISTFALVCLGIFPFPDSLTFPLSLEAWRYRPSLSLRGRYGL
jgi:hypothetical protein